MYYREHSRHRVTVLDMQPIEPPVGGGRLRLLGLYHGLGHQFQTTYIGTYDWPGEKYREVKISDTLLEIDIPLTEEHFSAADCIKQQTQGKTVIDVTFHQLAHLSPDYVKCARNAIRNADIIFFSHPWIYPLVYDEIDRERQLTVYDAQNIEGLLRYALLDDGGNGTEIAKEVARIEHDLCDFADRVLVCSHADRLLFHKIYGIALDRILVVPNGVFTNRIKPIPDDAKAELKKKLGLPCGPLATFLASAYPPNVEAANFILNRLAPELSSVTFAICGGVGGALDKSAVADNKLSNVIVTGFLEEERKMDYLNASDLGVNPMFSGSGTNIKMFDYMAAGLPVISTPMGARGIEQGARAPAFKLCEKESFAQGIEEVLSNHGERTMMARNARRLVVDDYSWERLSSELGIWIHRQLNCRTKRRTQFTVVVASYERHRLLAALVKRLEVQLFKDFEVVIVDQSAEPWPERKKDWQVDLLYIHTTVKGAVNARNKGVFYGRGEVIAFIDDDCRPEPSWLENANHHFCHGNIIGIEGSITTDHRYDPEYRTVTNEGFKGFGFMTANLFLKIDIFRRVGGFDGAFDHPHFREDTDLAWRALEHGEIPFCEDVTVYHPPHRRSTERESHAARVKFFEKDPLLLQKHPHRYRQLFLAEGHWQYTEGFWENFFRGAEKYGVEIPEWCLRYFSKYARRKIMKEWMDN